MFLAIEESVLVRADRKDLKLMYGEKNAGHGWIEIGDFVYDPTSQLKFPKLLYYKIFAPTNVKKYTNEEYCSTAGNKDFFQNIISTTLEDLKPGGRKRNELIGALLMREVAQLQGKTEFLEKLDLFLEEIQYDETTFGVEFHDDVFEKILI